MTFTKQHTITRNEWIFVGLIFIIGIVSYLKVWLVFLNSLNPVWNFFIYYGIFFVILSVLAMTKFVIFGHRISNWTQIVGTLLIIFSINVLLGWSNGYVTYATTGAFSPTMNIFYGCEDGVSWYLFHDIIGIKIIWLAKLFAFSIFPALVALLGVYLVKKVKIGLIN